MTLTTLAPPEFSPLILLVLILILCASAAIYAILVRRATTQHHWVALSEWASENGYRLSRGGRMPECLASLGVAGLAVGVRLESEKTMLLRLHPPQATGNAPAGHALVLQISAQWAPTGLRPTQHTDSLLDYFSLGSFPQLTATERFVVYGADSAAAEGALAGSAARVLMPPDVGLLLLGDRLILDFSTRPFDEIEFERMDALARQLAGSVVQGTA